MVHSRLNLIYYFALMLPFFYCHTWLFIFHGMAWQFFENARRIRRAFQNKNSCKSTKNGLICTCFFIAIS